MKKTETPMGNLKKVTFQTEYIEKCEMIEFICIPFSTEKERKQKNRAIKKEYKSSFFNFNKKVKHYTFKKLHLVVIIRGTDTGDLSKHKFPKIEFKNDCIQVIEKPQSKGIYDAYISHADNDRGIASEICYILEENDIKCWIAPRNIRPGTNFVKETIYGIENSSFFILILSENSNDSIYVKNEIEIASKYEKPIITFKIDNTEPQDNLEFYLRNSHWIIADSNTQTHYEDLLKELKRHTL